MECRNGGIQRWSVCECEGALLFFDRKAVFFLALGLAAACCSTLAWGADEALLSSLVSRLDCKTTTVSQEILGTDIAPYAALPLEALQDMAARETGSKKFLAYRLIGRRYESGDRVPRDPAKAVEFYRLAAFILPPSRAVYSPGFGSVPGSTTVLDEDAVTPADTVALSSLGRFYRAGTAVGPDAAKAEVLFACAANLVGKFLQEHPAPRPQQADGAAVSAIAVPKADSAMLDHETGSISLPANVTAIRWSPDGKRLAVSYDGDRRIAMVDPQNGRHLWSLSKELGGFSGQHPLQFSPDMSMIYTPSATTIARRDVDKTISVIDAGNGQIRRTLGYRPFEDGHAMAMDIAVSRDGRRVFVVPGSEGLVLVYDTASWSMSRWDNIPVVRNEVGASSYRANLAIDDDRDTLWLAHSGRIRKLSLANGEQKLEFQAFQVLATTLAVNHATGELVAGGSAVVEEARYPLNDFRAPFRRYEDAAPTLVRAYAPQSGKLMRTYLGPGGTVLGLSINPSGTLIAAVKSRVNLASHGYLLLWDAQSGKLLSSKDIGAANTGDVAFSPDGAQLAYTAGENIKFVRIPNKRH